MLETHKGLEPLQEERKQKQNQTLAMLKYAKAELIDNQQITEILNTYHKTSNTLETAKLLNLPYQEVSRVLINSGIKRVRKANRKSKYEIDKDYFKSIDAEDKAYFLGLLHADGSLLEVEGTLRLSISLNEKDKELVYKLCEALGLEKTKVKDRPQEIGDLQKSLTVYGIELLTPITDLKNRRVLDLLPSHLIRHFIRGVFDGDGSIYLHHSKQGRYQYYYASFIGYTWMMDFIKSQIEVETKIKKVKSDGIGRCEIFSSKDMYKLYDYMYKDATVFLTRKHAKFLDMKFSDSVSQRLNDRLPTIEGDDIV